jgi:hypothetical protein
MTKALRAQDRSERSGLRDFLTFLGLLLVIVVILGSWNAVQNLDDAHVKLWGELAFFGLIVWFSIVVLSLGDCSRDRRQGREPGSGYGGGYGCRRPRGRVSSAALLRP